MTQRRDKYGRFAPKDRAPTRRSPPKRDRFGRFVGETTPDASLVAAPKRDRFGRFLPKDQADTREPPSRDKYGRFLPKDPAKRRAARRRPAPRRGPKGRFLPRRRPRGRPPKEPKVFTYTTFRASGTMLSARSGQGQRIRYSAKIWSRYEDELVPQTDTPVVWYSNHGDLLGQVKWEGRIKLKWFIDQLNLRLQFFGEERSGFDFRKVYTHWQYTWQIVERRGETLRVVAAKNDGR